MNLEQHKNDYVAFSLLYTDYCKTFCFGYEIVSTSCRRYHACILIIRIICKLISIMLYRKLDKEQS